MLRAVLLLLSCLTNYESVRELAQSAFTAGLVSMSFLGCMGIGLVFRRRSLSGVNSIREDT